MSNAILAHPRPVLGSAVVVVGVRHRLSEKVEALRNLGALATIFVVFYHSRVTDLRLTRGGAVSVPPAWLRALDALLHWPGVALHVPIFFLISGFLFFRAGVPSVGQFRRKLQDRLGSLVAPFLLWNALLLAGVLLLQTVGLGTLLSHTRPVNGVGDALWRLSVDPIVFQFWFVRELVLLCLLTPLIGLVVRSRAALPWLALSFAGFALGLSLGSVLSARGIFFFCLGAFLALREAPLRLSMPRPALGMAAAVYGPSVVAAAFLRLPREAMSWVVAAQVVVGLGLVFSAYDASSPLWGSRLVGAVRAHAFFVYAFHEPLLSVVRKGFLALLGGSGGALAAEFFLVPAATLAICVLVAGWTSRSLPRLYGALTGGRIGVRGPNAGLSPRSGSFAGLRQGLAAVSSS